LRNRFPRQAAAPEDRPAGRASGVIVLALAAGSRLDVTGLGEPTMQPRESAPLWVGLTFVLMLVGTVMYVTGYFMVEDLLTFFKR
jgi:hypothetical protein